MFTEQQEKWIMRTEELFLRYGIKGLTMDDVARELGISKKTLYQFVENKDDLVMKVVELHIHRDISQCGALLSQASNALDEMFNILEFVTADLERVKTNVLHDMQRYHRDAWERMEQHQRGYILEANRQNLHRGISEGLYRSDLDVEITARLHVAQSFALFDEQLFPRSLAPLDKIFRQYLTLFLYAIVSEKGLAMLRSKLAQLDTSH
jgi:AcrR family transcriptional regulator